MKKVFYILGLVAVVLLLATCAAGVNTLVGTPNVEGTVAGFWRGLWNGIIAPVTFVISLFTRNVQMYEVHNNGGWYNFGFLLGVIIVFGGGAKGSNSRRWRR